jgi:hypothetical protein
MSKEFDLRNDNALFALPAIQRRDLGQTCTLDMERFLARVTPDQFTGCLALVAGYVLLEEVHAHVRSSLVASEVVALGEVDCELFEVLH